MTISEKVAYLKGLMDGLDLGDSKEARVLKAVADVLDDMALSVEDLESSVDELSEQVDSIDEDLGELEEDLYGDEDDDDDCDCDDEELYEVECPSCHDTICVDEEMLDEGEMECPNCGQLLEFDLDIDGCGCDCEECSGCDHDHND